MPDGVVALGGAVAFGMMLLGPGFAPLIGVLLIAVAVAWAAFNDYRSGKLAEKG